MNNICVFCGSGTGNNPIYSEVARELGKLLVERGHGLVFGGGHVGLMGVIAESVLNAGGPVVGVIPQALVERELAYEGLTELHIVETMHQRKALMASRSSGFIAIPGGLGTCDELFEILTWKQLGIHAKPVGILNVHGFFDALLNWIDHATGERLIRPKDQNLFQVETTPTALLDRMFP